MIPTLEELGFEFDHAREHMLACWESYKEQRERPRLDRYLRALNRVERLRKRIAAMVIPG